MAAVARHGSEWLKTAPLRNPVSSSWIGLAEIVNQIACSHCVAPLPVKPGEILVTCRYCGFTSEIETGRPYEFEHSFIVNKYSDTQIRELVKDWTSGTFSAPRDLASKASISESELLSHLSTLKDSELLYERGIYPQSNYIFKHALTREVVYDSILAKRKKKLHEEIGNAIEELFKDSLTEHYEVLSEHYFLGENYLKSAEYSKLAGRKAEKAASFSDAIAFAKKRIASIEQLVRTEEVEKQIIDARTVLGLYMAQMLYHIESKEAIDPIFNLAIKYFY